MAELAIANIYGPYRQQLFNDIPNIKSFEKGKQLHFCINSKILIIMILKSNASHSFSLLFVSHKHQPEILCFSSVNPLQDPHITQTSLFIPCLCSLSLWIILLDVFCLCARLFCLLLTQTLSPCGWLTVARFLYKYFACK